MKPRPPKPVLRVLEKCFENEIRGMPAQFAHGRHTINGLKVSGAVARAENEGLIEQVDERRAFKDGLPPMLIRGFALTHQGRIAYCRWAAQEVGE